MKLIDINEMCWSGELRGDGLLLRLGVPLQVLVPAVPAGIVDLADQESIDQLYQPPLTEWDSFELRPGQMVLCQVDQPLRLGRGLAGAIGTLSHLARVGLAAHLSSPWVLPGWDGHLTCELVNHGPVVLRVHRGMPVGRLVLFRMDGSVTDAGPHTFYGTGPHLGSRYAEEFPVHGHRR